MEIDAKAGRRAERGFGVAPRLGVGCALAVAVVTGTLSAAASGAPAPLSGTWVGSYRLGGDGRIALQVKGPTATVALGVGQSDAQTIRVDARGDRLSFRVPGRPTPITFVAQARGDRLVGTVTQADAKGTFTAGRGDAAELLARGSYGSSAVVDDPYGLARLVDLVTGRVRAIHPKGDAFAIGSGFATAIPSTGTASFTQTGVRIDGATIPRVRHRQLEVRFRSGGATLSGTFTLPTGSARHPAVVFVPGSGPTTRAYLPEIAAALVQRGVAVLVSDKRGIGQSGGTYPGESPTAQTIDTLARDAQAAARWLAAQPEIDPTHLGLVGHSQAGWIMPLAASREPSIRFLVSLSGPAVTADEVDLFQDLTGQGERRTEMGLDEIEAQVTAAGPSGVDPIPWIQAARIPQLWIYGALDQHVPARLSAQRLEPLAADPARDITLVTFARANHALVETTTGLTSEMLRSDTYAPGLFTALGGWFREHRLAG